MAQVTIYTKAYCPYCVRAKALLGQKGVQFDEIKIDEQPELRPAMIERANGRTTVPQIFIGDTHVGGCDDLFALENAGTLNSLLAAQ
ncbi:glutaredoxin 3 [Rheinheimera mesophila]|uniref:Glutaredoxin n=1 Tax=Rheinheimera mesophila TaxID=1547515 RepID=A0A3P3QS22_9GAMM|nr:glutaredoxin 3 [Rheinheimera mesophila]KKL01676.1 glutaredoxin [Rheinheimera mesophila]RRJ23835.1 glutaredoxin 3 [Rheinheimera mesophila]